MTDRSELRVSWSFRLERWCPFYRPSEAENGHFRMSSDKIRFIDFKLLIDTVSFPSVHHFLHTEYYTRGQSNMSP